MSWLFAIQTIPLYPKTRVFSVAFLHSVPHEAMRVVSCLSEFSSMHFLTLWIWPLPPCCLAAEFWVHGVVDLIFLGASQKLRS
jgi:hypothetical protein